MFDRNRSSSSDSVAPHLSAVSIRSSGVHPREARPGDTVTIRLCGDEPLSAASSVVTVGSFNLAMKNGMGLCDVDQRCDARGR